MHTARIWSGSARSPMNFGSARSELDIMIPKPNQVIQLRCGLECIFKCLMAGNDYSIDYECMHGCLFKCADVSKDASKTIVETNENLAHNITIGQVCSVPCNNGEVQVPEVVCDICKELSEVPNFKDPFYMFEEVEHWSIHVACIEFDPCEGDLKSWKKKWCKFCTAINIWIFPKQIKVLDTTPEQSSISIQSQPHCSNH